MIDQPRTLRALELGSEVSGPGSNIFVLGQPGSGRTTLSQEYLQRKAEGEPVPDDWCYVDNFEELHLHGAVTGNVAQVGLIPTGASWGGRRECMPTPEGYLFPAA